MQCQALHGMCRAPSFGEEFVEGEHRVPRVRDHDRSADDERDVQRVDDLLLWVYGWVGIAYLSMLHPDVWAAIDPNRRIARLVRTLLRRTTNAEQGPARRFDGRSVGVAALVGVVAIIWLELVATGGGGGAILLYAHALLAVWVITGRVGASDPDAWAVANDPLTAWFSMIGALRMRGLTWSATGAILTSVAVGSVIFDGLSQGQLFFDLFGVPAAPERTILLLAWLAAIALLAVIGLSCLARLWRLRRSEDAAQSRMQAEILKSLYPSLIRIQN
jgi:hypothetical protein